MEKAAQANGLSKSRWVAEIIRKYAAHERPQDYLSLAGRFADFPLREHTQSAVPADVTRLGFLSLFMLILDSNTIRYYFRGDSQVVPRLQALRPTDVGVPATVEYELRYGLSPSTGSRHGAALSGHAGDAQRARILACAKLTVAQLARRSLATHPIF